MNGELFFTTNIKQIQLFQVHFSLNNKIIEFDGTYWHSFENQKIKDKMRDDYLISKGFSLLIIDELVYKLNEQEVLNKCVTF